MGEKDWLIKWWNNVSAWQCVSKQWQSTLAWWNIKTCAWLWFCRPLQVPHPGPNDRGGHSVQVSLLPLCQGQSYPDTKSHQCQTRADKLLPGGWSHFFCRVIWLIFGLWLAMLFQEAIFAHIKRFDCRIVQWTISRVKMRPGKSNNRGLFEQNLKLTPLKCFFCPKLSLSF